MSQLSALLSEVKKEMAKHDERNFIQVKSKRIRTRNHITTNPEPNRPVIVSINPSPTQIHFASSMKNTFPQLNFQIIGELLNISDFFIQPEDQISKECLANTTNI